MSKNNEIVAVQVSGIGLHRLTLPVIFWGLVISIAAFAVQENLAPGANQKAQDALNIVRNIRHQTNLEFNKNWIITADNKFYFYNFYDKKNNRFIKFNIVQLNNEFEIKTRIFSKLAKWSVKNELILQNGFERTFNDKRPVDYFQFKSKKEIVKEGRGIFTKKIAFSQFMNISELRKYIDYLKKNKSDSEKYEAKLYYKYAFPFSSLVMVLIAIPFSFMMGNKGTLYGIGIAVGISMIYWGAIGIFSALGSTTLLSPFISAFAPVFIFGAVSIYLFINIKT
jgi:lipopolysaccharide export system permease protein